MATTTASLPRIKLAADEVATPVMVYVPGGLIWGSVVTHKALSAMRVLIGSTPPDYVALFNGQMLMTSSNQLGKTFKRREFHIPSREILAYHLMPPHREELHFDETEMNRKMEPFTAIVGAFHFNSEIRMAEQANLKSFLSVAKSDYLEVANTEVLLPSNPNLQPIITNYALLRREYILFSTRT